MVRFYDEVSYKNQSFVLSISVSEYIGMNGVCLCEVVCEKSYSLGTFGQCLWYYFLSYVHSWYYITMERYLPRLLLLWLLHGIHTYDTNNNIQSKLLHPDNKQTLMFLSYVYICTNYIAL